MRVPGRNALYGVFQRWAQDCLVGDGSLLHPGAAVWTPANVAVVKQAFVDEPDEGGRSFEDKPADQAASLSREQRLLLVEVRAIQMLPMSDVSAATKRSELDGALEAVGVHLPEGLPDDVAHVLDMGFAAYGLGRTAKYWHLSLILERVDALKAMRPAERREELEDPAAWKRLLTDTTLKRVSVMRNMLLHGMHPASFVAVASASDKRKIAAAFPALADADSELDAALEQIQRTLTEQRGEHVNLWDDEVRAVWNPTAVEADDETPAHPSESRWRADWAAFVVERYRAAGGAPSLPDDPERPEAVRKALTELAETADASAFLASLREIDGVRNYWSGPYTWTVTSIVDDASEPARAARALADALLAPSDDEEAAAKVVVLDELRAALSGGVYGGVLAAHVWSWQDNEIGPWTLAERAALKNRGWYDADHDDATWFLTHQERLDSLEQPMRWLFPALDALDRQEEGLRALPPVDVERCAAAAAGDEVDLVPVLADLETIVRNLTPLLGDEDLEVARSVPDGPDVWVELRQHGSAVVRLVVGGNGLAVARPANNGEPAAGLSFLGHAAGELVVTDEPSRWLGRILAPGHAASEERLGAAVIEVARPVGQARLDLAAAFAAWLPHHDEARTAQAHRERDALAEALRRDALADPDVELLRQIINTGKYGGPGPMSALNRSINELERQGRLDILGDVLLRLCHGDGDVADRIDQALASDITGLGESVVMKCLSLTDPDRFLPVFPYTGAMGKSRMLEVLGLEEPSSGATRGERQVQANDRLRGAMAELTDDPWIAKEFLYWIVERTDAQLAEAGETDVDVEDDEDRLGAVADRCFVGRRWIDDVVALLEDRRQLVMYGPPGTGKTFLTLQIAAALAPDPDRVRVVQFHPAYSYEDFFEGLRPRTTANDQLVYELTDGPLKSFAQQAAADSRRRTHVLVIDEINRANLPKVFGELLFLLEYRDRRITTMYGKEPFSLPDNLLIMATMNTADRSIALVDAALRRRFHFVPLFPGRPPLVDTLAAWLDDHGEEPRIAALLEHVNAQLVDRLGSGDLQIGPSHFMRPGISRGRALERVWRYSIEPLLEEQLYGDDDAIDALRWGAVKTQLAAAPPAVVDEPDLGSAE